MITPQDIERELLDYFAAVGAAPGHVFGIRDFDSQVMMNAFNPEERAGLHVALASLVAGGVILPVSAIEYTLTAPGLQQVADLRAKKREVGFTSPPRVARKVPAKCS